MAERFKAIVLKTIVVESHRGFESLSVRSLGSLKSFGKEKMPSVYPPVFFYRGLFYWGF